MRKQCKDWKEAYEFILDNMGRCCLNCKYGTDGRKDIREDKCYQHIFCVKSIVMVNLLMGQGCKDWEDGQYEESVVQGN